MHPRQLESLFLRLQKDDGECGVIHVVGRRTVEARSQRLSHTAGGNFARRRSARRRGFETTAWSARGCPSDGEASEVELEVPWRVRR